MAFNQTLRASCQKHSPASVLGLLIVTLCFTLFADAGKAEAGSHLWRVQELFSNPDGTIQFIEMKECCGASSEVGLNGKWVQSAASGLQYVFPENLTGDTSDRRLLLATAGFAALPGAPMPDHIIPDNFFSTNADTITYWMYGAATLTFASGELPSDGLNSLDRSGTTAVNSPTNYAGETGSVDVSVGGGPTEFLRGDANQNGMVEIADSISILGVLFSGDSTSCASALDVNDDEGSDISDAIFLLSYLFSGGSAPGTPFMTCGDDPTAGGLTCDSFDACP